MSALIDSKSPIIRLSNKKRTNNRIAKELTQVIENEKGLPLRYICHKEIEDDDIVLAMIEYKGVFLIVSYPAAYPFKPLEIKVAKGSEKLSSIFNFSKSFITYFYKNENETRNPSYYWSSSVTLYSLLSLAPSNTGTSLDLNFTWEDNDSDVYCDQRLHPALFMPSYLPEEMRFGAQRMVDVALDPLFVILTERVKAFYKNTSSASAAGISSSNEDFGDAIVPFLDSLIKDGLINEETDGVYSFPVFTKEFCNMFLEEKDNYFKVAAEQSIRIIRPNSMNNYGLIIDHIGMRDVISDFRKQYMQPISQLFFPKESTSFDYHHAFIVSYEGSKDTHLDMHHDASTVTWNICLGKEGFVGSGLTFCGSYGKKDHRKVSYQYQHRIGRAVIHRGRRRHGADIITEGERHNLIIWNSNQEYETAMEATHREGRIDYEKEEGPPDLQCVSYTHDRDFVMFKEYPLGTIPRSRADLPWCPPESKAYDGIASIEEINSRLDIAKEREMMTLPKKRSDVSEAKSNETERSGSDI